MESNERTTRLIAIILTLLLAFAWTIFDPHDHGGPRGVVTSPDADDPEVEPQGAYTWNLRFLRGVASAPVANLDVSISVPGRRDVVRQTDREGCCKVVALHMDDGLSRVAFIDPDSGAEEHRTWLGRQIDAATETIVRVPDPGEGVSLSMALREGAGAITCGSGVRISLGTSRERRIIDWTGIGEGAPSALADLGAHPPGTRGEIEVEYPHDGVRARRSFYWTIREDRSVATSDSSVRVFRAPDGRGVVFDVDVSVSKRIEGRLVDHDGRPIADRWCAFLEPESSESGAADQHSMSRLVWRETDAQGRFAFDARSGVRRREWEYTGTLLVVALENGVRDVRRIRMEGEGPFECVVDR